MGDRFQAAYLQDSAPWDIGRPQSEFIQLYEAGDISGRVFDAGCGTGENALYLASVGLEVTGMDSAPAAIERARRKASERGLVARFDVTDVLDLSAFAGQFDAGIDSGCFHVFDDEQRVRYVRSLHVALKPLGRMFVVCFSERQPGDWGPRRVTQRELRDAFSDGWRVDRIDAAHFDVNEAALGREPDVAPPRIEAWLTVTTRL